MDIRADIQKQILAGFSKEEIYKNLEDKGYRMEDIELGYTKVSNSAEIKHRYGKLSPWSIILGIVCLIVAVVRLVLYDNNGNTLLLIGVFTATLLGFFFFTRRK
jgi:LPXTG-motif cell wall-anchored protein